MIKHSMIIEGFFDDPHGTRKLILNEPMTNHKAEDGATYPGIVELPESIRTEIGIKMHNIFGPDFKENLMFARHSLETMTPPHWAHSDLNMTQYVALVYLSPTDYPWDGTHCVRHKETGLETHPETEEQVKKVMRDSNEKNLWDSYYTCPSRFNRMFVLNARFMHAAAYRYGLGREDSRLVLSVFFNLR